MAATRCGRTMTPRIQALREDYFAREYGTCYARALAVTRSYRQTEGEPAVLRRAKAFYETVTTVPLYIREGELLVGSRSSEPGRRTAYPEYQLNSDKDWPEEVRSYWEGRTVRDYCHALFTDVIDANDRELSCGYVTGTATGYGHLIVDYEKVLKKGFRGIRAEAEAELATAGTAKEKAFLEAVMIVSDAMTAWANRYADLAEEQAKTADPERKAELLKIAKICRKVPEYPAESFHEALQSFVFTHLAIHIEQYGWSVSAGRFDQYMFPYYEKDLVTGVLTADEAWELLLSCWMKFMENIHEGIGATTFQNLTIGGQDAEGRDMSNALSHLILDATAATRFIQPAVSLRWHKNIDPDFWMHAMEVIGQGMGMPALFSEDVIIRALELNGVSHEDALGYGIVGCVEPSVCGKEQGMTSGGHLNLAKIMELTMFNGRSGSTGKMLGIETGDPVDFPDFETFFEAYARQTRFIAGVNIQAAQIAADAQKHLVPCPLTSALLSDCIREHRDMVDGGTRYSLSGVCIMGATNAVDAMMNIKRLVYEQKKVDMAELVEALRTDFEGKEALRQLLLHQPDRFGNDREEADAMANRVYGIHAAFNKEHPDARNGHYTNGVWPVNTHVGAGMHTFATPDGRHAGTPLVDGVGAVQGIDTHGPTALLRSVASLENVTQWEGGNTCNIKFSASSVKTENALKNIGFMTDTFMRLGGQELQVNVVDNSVLYDAQAHPENYQDLVVRVAGYSAYFTRLNKAVQDEIISRNTQEAV
ncbi:MAG: hypothetical protein IJM76_01610 [Lachnospiraceae bacterium]|nr:hypothetical protein [Lachnospiraceae bacterium]